jgi:large subunit ribosomal protein L21
MYAIIEDGGRQYRVEEGQVLEIDYRDTSSGDPITFEKVLVGRDDDGVKIGTPDVAGATVTAEVMGTSQGQKLVVQKFRKRKNSRRKTGHRQLYTQVKIAKIQLG